MRITGGQYKGIPLLAPKGMDTRPTTDKVRQALFNILRHTSWWDGFENTSVLDAFCGTGALGLEALSHGASKAEFWDISKPALDITLANCQKIKREKDCKILKRNATGAYAQVSPFDLIFLDPPYKKDLGAKALETLHQSGAISDTTILVLESAKTHPEPFNAETFEELDCRPYGDTEIRILKLKQN